MKSGWIFLVGIAMAGAAAAWSRADMATGTVYDVSRGAFKLQEGKDLIRQFYLSAKTSEYTPEYWRPVKGDKVTVAFTVSRNTKRATLVADTVTLVTPGPHTLVNIANPMTVEITEVGRSGIFARTPSKQIIRFATGRHTAWTPAGWIPMAGQKAVVTFKAEKMFGGFGVNFVAEKIEKAP